MAALHDRFHQEITVGCVIAYPGRSGSDVWITTGTVTEVLVERPPGMEEWRHWHPKVKVDGGSRGPGKKQLGRRTVGYRDDMIVLFKAGT